MDDQLKEQIYRHKRTGEMVTLLAIAQQSDKPPTGDMADSIAVYLPGDNEARYMNYWDFCQEYYYYCNPSEVERLRREVERLREENAELSRAVGILKTGHKLRDQIEAERKRML